MPYHCVTRPLGKYRYRAKQLYRCYCIIKKSKIKELKDSLEYWKDKFQRVVKFIHDKIHGIFGDKDDKYKEMADNLFINGIIDEKEYTSVINKKDKNRDDFER